VPQAGPERPAHRLVLIMEEVRQGRDDARPAGERRRGLPDAAGTFVGLRPSGRCGNQRGRESNYDGEALHGCPLSVELVSKPVLYAAARRVNTAPPHKNRPDCLALDDQQERSLRPLLLVDSSGLHPVVGSRRGATSRRD
jgi:hypothetical protein